MFTVALPKGFMFQNINRRPKKTLPRKIPGMRIYSKMVKNRKNIRIAAKGCARPGYV